MQILKNWYGGQLDASIDTGSDTKSPLKILQVSHDLHTLVKLGMQILSGSMGQPILMETPLPWHTTIQLLYALSDCLSLNHPYGLVQKNI